LRLGSREIAISSLFFIAIFIIVISIILNFNHSNNTLSILSIYAEPNNNEEDEENEDDKKIDKISIHLILLSVIFTIGFVLSITRHDNEKSIFIPNTD